MTPLEFLQSYCICNEKQSHLWLLLAISRNKMNKGMKTSEQEVHKYVIKSQRDIVEYYSRIKRLTENSNLNFYLYVSAVARDAIKAFCYMQQYLCKLNSEMILNPSSTIKLLSTIDKKWFSILEESSCRTSKKWVLDIDSKEYFIINQLEKYNIPILLKRETPNGWHWVTEPFDKRELEQNPLFENYLEIKKDSMLFVEKIFNT